MFFFLSWQKMKIKVESVVKEGLEQKPNDWERSRKVKKKQFKGSQGWGSNNENCLHLNVSQG